MRIVSEPVTLAPRVIILLLRRRDILDLFGRQLSKSRDDDTTIPTMICSRCGLDNPASMKFCGNCAAPLVSICAKCRAENPPQFKFCGQCAAPLGLRLLQRLRY